MMKAFNTKRISVVASALIALGLAGTLPALYFHFQNGSVSAHALPSKPVNIKPGQTLISGQPTEISVPSVNIDIPVINGYYNENSKEWTLSLDKAQFAAPTTLPNNLTGNTFIYGHYRLGVFYTLPHIKSGDEATITTDNGYKFTYRFYQTYPTQPTDTSVLHYQGPPILTLQTCSGSYYQNRQMYLFSFVKYEKV